MDIKKLLRWAIEHIYTILILFSLLGAGAVIVLTWLEQLPLYQLLTIVLFVVLGVFALAFLGINQFHKFQIRRKKNITELSDREIEETIRNWLDDPIFKFQRKNIPDFLFWFIVTDEQGRPVTIARPKTEPSHLELITSINLAEEHRKNYEKLNSSDKGDIVHTLRIEMARLGISYGGIDDTLGRVTLTDVVLLDDSLTEFYLRQRIFYVKRAFILYSEIIAQRLGSISEPGIHKEGSQHQ